MQLFMMHITTVITIVEGVQVAFIKIDNYNSTLPKYYLHVIQTVTSDRITMQ